MTSSYPIVIIGAGLSGLYAAWLLHQRGEEVLLLEARQQCGGRILSPKQGQDELSRVDLGPAWVWPEFQPRLEQLAATFSIGLFKQYTSGKRLYEIDATAIEQLDDQSVHDMSFRLVGGAGRLIDALQQAIPDSCICCDTKVTHIEDNSGDDCIDITSEKTGTIKAAKVIMALPPRVSLQSIDFSPALPGHLETLWQSTPTWMASHCKFVFIYDRPFWREKNLSGEVFSRHGPLTEIYDGSPQDDKVFALTAFVGLDANQRRMLKPEQLAAACMAQLKRLFGEASQHVVDVHFKDWSLDEYTCTAADIALPAHHPQYPPDGPRSMWDDRILFAGTEVARMNGGYIEGALESADEAVRLLMNSL